MSRVNLQRGESFIALGVLVAGIITYAGIASADRSSAEDVNTFFAHTDETHVERVVLQVPDPHLGRVVSVDVDTHGLGTEDAIVGRAAQELGQVNGQPTSINIEQISARAWVAKAEVSR